MKIKCLILFICNFIFAMSFGLTQNISDSLNREHLIEESLILGKISSFPIYDSLIREYTVSRIKHIDNAYIIDIKDNDDFRFTIVSLKKENENNKKIKKNRKYKFMLYSYYNPNVIIIGDPIFQKIVIDEIPVCFKEDFKTGIIVTTPNLRGLYYRKP